MATVPGDPNERVVPMLPEWAKPTMADFLQAAHITTERQRLAGDVVPFRGAMPPTSMQEIEDWQDKQAKIRTEQTLIRAGVGKPNILPMTPKDK